MTRRLPVVPTIVVALAVAAMIGLGVWQIQRLHWKEDLLARYAANENLPAVALPRADVGDALLFRRAHATCLDPTGWQREAGRSADGAVGWRQIAHCTAPGGGPGFFVQIGIADSPSARPDWRGGPVTGFLNHAPDHRPLVAGLVGDRAPARLMLVADRPARGLKANSGPDLSSVPNNHFAYAVQWFLFAAVALAIYALALRRRWRGPLATPPARG